MAALKASTSLSIEEKTKYSDLMRIEYMSSEESDEETGANVRMFVTRPLPWRSQEATAVIESLDRKSHRRRSSRALEMVVKRKTGMPSSRGKPEGPEWAMHDTNP